jgi:uncharacterized protein (TIGR03435 family)
MLKSRLLGAVGIVAVVGGIVGGLAAQTPASPAFDVVSIKPSLASRPGDSHFTVRSGGYLSIADTSLREIIRTAYAVQDQELIGGPESAMRSSYDVEARAEGLSPLRFPPGLETPTHPVYAMLRAMLADRFKLSVHHETRSLPVYAVELARKDGTLGPNFTHSTKDCGPTNAARGTDHEDRTPTATGGLPCGILGSVTTHLHVVGDSQSIEHVMFVLGGYAQRPLVDRTGLMGLFNFVLDINLDPQPGGSDDAPSFFTAAEEQLGLKLVATTAPLDVVVIDHVEPATPN